MRFKPSACPTRSSAFNRADSTPRLAKKSPVFLMISRTVNIENESGVDRVGQVVDVAYAAE